VKKTRSRIRSRSDKAVAVADWFRDIVPKSRSVLFRQLLGECLKFWPVVLTLTSRLILSLVAQLSAIIFTAASVHQTLVNHEFFRLLGTAVGPSATDSQKQLFQNHHPLQGL
jgi:hypothetical protein